MNAHGPKSMVSPDTAMLSVFITPWMNPTLHPSSPRAWLWRAMTERNSSR